MKNSLFVSAAALIVTGAASAQFSGAYAPGTWSTSGVGIGGSSVVFAADGSRLTIQGSDGAGGVTTTVSHTVVGSGTWTFDWSWTNVNTTPGFDAGYYTINGTKFLLSDAVGGPFTGSVSVPVTAGQTIGWQVVTVDGLFGPGTLVINQFEIPAPGALALLGVAGLAGSRRRR
jgi:uncharacterized protein (TIGR03382 family)